MRREDSRRRSNVIRIEGKALIAECRSTPSDQFPSTAWPRRGLILLNSTMGHGHTNNGIDLLSSLHLLWPGIKRDLGVSSLDLPSTGNRSQHLLGIS
jgi:hypothetical protein